MNSHQQLLIKNRTNEMRKIANQLEVMPINNTWINVFSEMAFYRNWRDLDNKSKSSQILNIAKVNSPSVHFIIEQTHSKIGLQKIEEIATVITNEKDRAKIAKYLKEKSWKEAEKDIELIIAGYKDQEIDDS